MKRIIEKIVNNFKLYGKTKVFILVLFIVGVISGSIFGLLLNSNDKLLVANSLNQYFNNIVNPNLFDLLNIGGTNLLYSIVIWFLGLTLVGIPLIIVIIYSKSFIIGFSLISILINYKLKGIIYIILYIFPHQIINLFIYAIISMYAIRLGSNLIKSIIKKEKVDYNLYIRKYFYILIVSLIIIIITSLYETFILPYIIKLIVSIL